MTTKVCTSCKRERKISEFRKRKKQGRTPDCDPLIATCGVCEKAHSAGSYQPPKIELKPRIPYEADPTDPDVIRFRKEKARRGA